MEFPGVDIGRKKQSMAKTWKIAIPDKSAKAARTADLDIRRDSSIVSH